MVNRLRTMMVEDMEIVHVLWVNPRVLGENLTTQTLWLLFTRVSLIYPVEDLLLVGLRWTAGREKLL